MKHLALLDGTGRTLAIGLSLIVCVGVCEETGEAQGFRSRPILRIDRVVTDKPPAVRGSQGILCDDFVCDGTGKQGGCLLSGIHRPSLFALT